LDQSDIVLFPNPTKGEIQILTDLYYTLIVTDLSGKELLSCPINETITFIDLSNYKTGIYYLEFRNSDTIVYYKIIKN